MISHPCLRLFINQNEPALLTFETLVVSGEIPFYE